MSRLFLLVNLFLLAATASAVEDQAKYDAYKQRRAERRVYALNARRAMNAGKVHVYRTAVVIPYNPIGTVSAIQQGWVQQPAIVVRQNSLCDLLYYSY